jgi:intracellular protein transport protein USO1
LLLTSLTPSSNEIQKLVAFENVFDRIFAILSSEGGLALGGITIQDCLSLLANLLRLNVSNQSFFRETGCVPKLARIMAEAMQEQEAEDDLPDVARVQRDKNIWGVLAVLRLFLVQGGSGTAANQNSFWQSGIVTQVLLLAFGKSTGPAVRAEVRPSSYECFN